MRLRIALPQASHLSFCPFGAKAQSLHCSSFSHQTHFVGLWRGPQDSFRQKFVCKTLKYTKYSCGFTPFLTKNLSSDSLADLCGIALLFDRFRDMLIWYEIPRTDWGETSGNQRTKYRGRGHGSLVPLVSDPVPQGAEIGILMLLCSDTSPIA